MDVQKITLKIFFPAMYLCATLVILFIWGETFFGTEEGDFFIIIPTLFIVGLASIITWLVSVIIELKNIAKAKK